MPEKLDYSTLDTTNPDDVYRLERYEALTLLDMFKDNEDMLMWVLSVAWVRGHYAAEELGLTVDDNPYLPKQKETL